MRVVKRIRVPLILVVLLGAGVGGANAAYAQGIDHVAPKGPPPFYADKTNLLVTVDVDGKETPVESAADWQQRRAHILANMQLVMGPLPPPSRKVPLNLQVLEEVQLERFARKKSTYPAEKGDRVPLMFPEAGHDFPSLATKASAAREQPTQKCLS